MSKSSILKAAAIFAAGWVVGTNVTSLHSVMVQPSAEGVPMSQLQKAFTEASPQIVQGEYEKLNKLCGDNADVLNVNGIDCEKIRANYKPAKWTPTVGR